MLPVNISHVYESAMFVLLESATVGGVILASLFQVFGVDLQMARQTIFPRLKTVRVFGIVHCTFLEISVEACH